MSDIMSDILDILRDETPERNATAEELALYAPVSQQIQQLDNSNIFDANDSNDRLIVISFDGTRNSRDENPTYNPNVSEDEINTNPDILESLISETNTVKPIYIPGVGTDGVVDHNVGAALGHEVVERAEFAYEQFETEVVKLFDQNPDANVHLTTLAFSRGNASQVHFANLVHNNGVPDPKNPGDFLIAPGEIQYDGFLAYDPVFTTTDGTLGFPLGDRLLTGVPSSVNQVVEFRALHEDRNLFGLDSFVDPAFPDDPGIHSFSFAGAHADIGGGHSFGGLSYYTLDLGHQFLSRLNVPIEQIPNNFLPDPNNPEILIHNSGFGIPFLNDSGSDNPLFLELGARGIIFLLWLKRWMRIIRFLMYARLNGEGLLKY